MKKITFTYGIISGIIVSAMLVLSLPLHKNGTLNPATGMVAGYASMVIALSLIFFAIRGYREYLGGSIGFWPAVGAGLTVTLVAALLYAVTWEVCYHTIASDFMDGMTEYYVQDKIARGGSPEEVEAVRHEMQDLARTYENPLIRFGMTLFEILPVGLVITLISAGLLRQKKILPPVPPSGKS